MPPTLLVKGNLLATKWSPPQKDLDDLVPIDYIMDWFDKRTPKAYGSLVQASSIADRILIVHSSTGSGKSTVMPAELFHRFYTRLRKNFAVTQPRVLTAIDIPLNQIVPFNSAEALQKAGKRDRSPLLMDDNIGYQTGMEARKPVKGVIFMTIGIIVQQINIMSDEDFMNKYSHIIIDEAHERSTDTDTALFSLKKFIERNYKNPACPFLIVTSATFNAYKYADYLLGGVHKNTRYENIIYVRGSTYPIERNYLEYDSADFIQTVIDTVEQIHINNPQDFLSPTELEKAKRDNPKLFELRDSRSPGTSRTSRIPETPEKHNTKGKRGGVEEPGESIHTFRLLEDELPDTDLHGSGNGPFLRVIGSGGEGGGEGDAEERNRAFRDIIIFVSGGFEITQIARTLQNLNSRNPYFQKYPIFPVQLTSSIVVSQGEDYRNLFADMSKLKVEIRTPKGEGGGGGGRVGKKWNDKKHDGKMKIALVPAVRRVIISTNVAETGITIDTLRYVIDTGFVNSSEYAPNYNADMLVLKPVTQGMHTQRSGRSGRKAPGVSYAMFTKETLESLQVDQYPDIIKEKIALVVLNFLIKQIDEENRNNNETLFDLFVKERISEETDSQLSSTFERELAQKKVNIYDMDLLDIPSADALQSAMETLFTLGAINSNSIPTPVGFIMNKFRMVKPESVRMILSGYAWGAPIIDLVTIAAFLEQKPSNIFPKDLEPAYTKANNTGMFTLFPDSGKINRYSELKTQLFVADDFIRYVIIFSQFQQRTVSAFGETDLGSVRKWCEDRGVSYRALTDTATLRDNIIANMTNIGLNAFVNNDKCMRYTMGSYSDYDKMEYVKKIKQCIFEGYKLNIGVYDATTHIYKSRKCNLPLKIGKTSTTHFLSESDRETFGDTNPKFIIFGEVRLSRNTKTNIYAAEAVNICILDGFIPYDANFDALV